MTERNVRPVTDNERLELVRANIIQAAQIVEAVKVAFEDGIRIVPREAVRELTECLNLLNSAYVDLVPVEDDSYQFDAITDKKIVRLANPDSPDTGIN